MSTNINAEDQPDLSALQNLANQFFKALPGQSIKPEPAIAQAPEPLRQDALPESYEPRLYDQALRDNSFDHSPTSASGVGVSPSAANQNNAVDLRNPQTGFADPNLAGSKPAGDLQLPFQEDQPFEIRLEEILNNVRISSPAVKIPFDHDTDLPYYFLKNRNNIFK